jgi:hypothetical protein
MKRRLRLGAALGAAAAFAPKAWTNAWGALVLFALVLASPAFLPDAWRGQAVCCLVWGAAAVLSGLALEGGLYRLGVTRTVREAQALGLGIGGLQLGRAELRLLGAGLLVLLFLCLAAAAGGVLLAFVMSATGLAETHWGDAMGLWRMALASDGRAIVLAGFAAAVGWAVLQLGVRLSLYKAATVARSRMVSLDAMSMAQGSFWPLLAGVVLISLPGLLLAGWKPDPALFGASGERVLAVIRAAIVTLVQVPLAIGFLSSAYKQLEYWSGSQDGGN